MQNINYKNLTFCALIKAGAGTKPCTDKKANEN